MKNQFVKFAVLSGLIILASCSNATEEAAQGQEGQQQEQVQEVPAPAADTAAVDTTK